MALPALCDIITNLMALRERLLGLLDDFPKRKLIVVGDLIADEFLYGQISRVSREAPVLVLDYRNLMRLLGGAANAANNLVDLGCRVVVAGVVGEDEAGQNLLETMKLKGADIGLVRKPKRYSTPIKTRILAGAHHSSRQQVVRVDRGAPLDRNSQPPWTALERRIEGSDGIILSDYDYGVVTPELLERIRHLARRMSIPLVVDSRFRMAEFKGVTSITPNITELEAAVGVRIGGDLKLLRKIGRRVLRKQQLDCLLVTQGRFGMTLFQPRRAPIHIPVFGGDEVADVTGAGDTVIAVFTLALSCGGTPEEAARLANYAGGIVVMKRGTATVTRGELGAALRDDLPS